MTDFQQMFSQNYDFIHRYLRKLCRDEDLAEELTQETFFRAYMNLSSLRDQRKLTVWLCQIGKNAYFAWYNAQKKQTALDETFPSDQDPERDYLQKELTGAAMEALEQLDEPYKQVMILSVFGEISLKEISEIYGKSESWARVTFYRGKQKILERIG